MVAVREGCTWARESEADNALMRGRRRGWDFGGGPGLGTGKEAGEGAQEGARPEWRVARDGAGCHSLEAYPDRGKRKTQISYLYILPQVDRSGGLCISFE